MNRTVLSPTDSSDGSRRRNEETRRGYYEKDAKAAASASWTLLRRAIVGGAELLRVWQKCLEAADERGFSAAAADCQSRGPQARRRARSSMTQTASQRQVAVHRQQLKDIRDSHGRQLLHDNRFDA